MSELTPLSAVSPIDGRYHSKTSALSPYFSEWALMRYRVHVEAEYFIALCHAGVPALSQIQGKFDNEIRAIYQNFSEGDGLDIKNREKVTNHDVKAVEYFLKDKFQAIDPALAEAKEYIHFGLTSQDINNTAQPLMIKEALRNVILPGFGRIVELLESKAKEWENISMLARTHGQPASPTLLSKEIRVFSTRLQNHLDEGWSLAYPAKFGGATGNLNAHFVAFPETDWHLFAKNFVEKTLGLSRSYPTTQIEHYDGLGRIFDCIKRLNVILTDLSIDCWLYIMEEYFTQKTISGEIGSSAMPHKVNPIDFENAEGNLGLSNALLEFLSRKLPVSRLQRDLTDSTILRNVGVAFAHSLLAILSLQKGLDKLQVNRKKIASDLDNNWAVVAEAIQTILRREGYPQPYEKLKELTRGKQGITAESIAGFIETLEINESVRAELRNISPSNFTGREK